MKITREGSGLFRKYFVLTASIILASFAFLGISLSLLVSGLWMNEKLDALEENTFRVTESTKLVLQSKYFNTNTQVIMVCSNLYQFSEAADADMFVINEEGEVVYCKEIVAQGSSWIVDGKCLIHHPYKIRGEILETIRENNIYRGQGNLDGILPNPHFVVACPIFVGGKFVGAVVATQQVMGGLLPYLISMLRLFAVGVIITFLFAFILVYLISYSLTKPLRQMSSAARQYAAGDFSARITVKRRHLYFDGKTEVDELAESFNSMASALSRAEMSRRNFVSNVSHELKTPMTIISGFIDGILDGTIEKAEYERCLTVISDEVKRLSRLVTGMLNISKIEEGEIDLNRVYFDMVDMIFRTLLNFEKVISDKSIDIIGLEELAKEKVYADEDMINQVVYNLIDNAVKFTPLGGYIHIFFTADSEKVTVKVRNSGKGIEDQEKEKIFERFYKVDKSRSFDVKSAGMGLHICKTLVELHGGKIDVEDKQGEYTEFFFTLPKE